MHKIIRGICYFTKNASLETVKKLDEITSKITEKNYFVQTKRICIDTQDIFSAEKLLLNDASLYISVGTLPYHTVNKNLATFYSSQNTSFNIDLTTESIDTRYSHLLFNIIKHKPEKTFLFAFVFNNKKSSPFFPSASYEKEGFSIGLQSTDLASECHSLDEWFEKMHEVWNELYTLFANTSDFLGIDSCPAPLLGRQESFIGFIKNLGLNFSQSVTTDTYIRISKFLKNNNPKPVGLCGLMFPCLEDNELAKEYEAGNFSIERNLFLSLHSGLGIDTYPIGIDESLHRVEEILQLVQELSNKYQKALSVRFVSDGKAKIGEKTDFNNEFLTDIVIQKL